MWIQFVLGSLVLYLFLWLLERDRHHQQRKRKDVTNYLPGSNSVWDTLLIGIKYLGMPNYIVSATLSKTFGPVFGIKYPAQYAVGILDLGVAKKIMSASDWINRLPDNHILYEGMFKKPLGLLFSNGEHWRQCRRFSLKMLHEFGFQRQTNVENVILFEMDYLHEQTSDAIARGGGKADLCVHQMFEISTLNVVWNLLSGQRFELDDPDAQMFLQSVNDFNREFNLGATPLDLFPFLRFIPKLTSHDSWMKCHRVFQKFFKKIIVQKRSQGLYKDMPSDYIDYFLKEIDNRSHEKPKYFTDESLVSVLKDMFLAGADTTNSSLEFAILHMALNPQIQTKVQAEIDTFIGRERQPSINDKRNMLYTQAVLNEVLRFASSIPSVSRSPLDDNQINGYFVPKGAITVINLHGIHYSEKIWKEPNSFNPERFLNSEGTQIVNTDKIIPFGYGKRVCIGETVARTTLFLFFTSLLQKYTFAIPENYPRPSLKNLCGLSRCPVPYHVSIAARQAD